MNLLFDSWCSQVMYQQQAPSYPVGVSPGSGAPSPTGQRLNTLLGAIESIGLSSSAPWNVSFTEPPITADQLDGIDVYISFTRYLTAGFAYTTDELDALQSFIDGGGSVLLMTNHGGFPNRKTDNWTANDAALANLFGVSLQDYSVQDWNGSDAVLTVGDGVPYVANQAATIYAHNSCIIEPPDGSTELVSFPDSWTAYDPSTNQTVAPPTSYFAAYVPPASEGAGGLIVIGNSGWVGDYGSPSPACGLIPYNNNLMFVLNCIGYLGGLTTIPPAGRCP